jgi:glucose/arabinose dehydrogenase
MSRARIISGLLGAAAAAVLLLAGCGSGTGSAPSATPGGGGAALSAAPTASPAPTTAGASARSATSAIRAATRLPALGVEAVGSFDQPVYVTSPPGDASQLYVVEKTGRVRIVKNGTVLAAPFLDISSRVSSVGERGLLSIAFDPRFATTRRVYAYYTGLDGAIRIVWLRATADALHVVSGSMRTLLTIPHPATNHNGGQLQFGPDGRLYAGIGDGGNEGDPHLYGQDRRVLYAKLLRFNVRAAHPRPQRYAYGLRNPWRFSFDRQTGALWIGDVGQDQWEEIDYLRKGAPPGANFGWSAYEGTHPYKSQSIDRRRLVWPVYQYSHAVGSAVTGGYVYRGQAIPGLRGVYLFADSGSGRFWAMRGPRASATTITFRSPVSSPASFGEDAAGELYVVSLGGTVYRIVPR